MEGSEILTPGAGIGCKPPGSFCEMMPMLVQHRYRRSPNLLVPMVLIKC
jgi:hypothetical protein